MRQRVDGLRRGKKLDTDRVVARVQFAMAQHGQYTPQERSILRGKRAMFTLTAKPLMWLRACAFGIIFYMQYYYDIDRVRDGEGRASFRIVTR